MLLGEVNTHIPDGLMDPVVVGLGWAIALPFIALAVYKLNKKVDERMVPFMAILAAGIFVAQMLNFPVGGGTTGHLVGAALAVILLGLYGGILVLTTILVIQCLVFGDGGLTALGLNLLNMAVIAPLVSYGVLRLLKKHQSLAVPLAAWASVFLAALACGLLLALSYTISGGDFGIVASVSIPGMAGWHAIIAIGEALITTGVVVFISRVAPEMLEMGKNQEVKEAVV
ncbi:MAG TPA: energy-coupling factor ABC transporter permease [Methanomassiliicoccales archaeon]|nr:energy-coupling factor ABC transporter permease [Methanomassiliicoccales archaeon]